MIDGKTSYLYLHNFGMELKGSKKSPVHCTCDSAHETFGSTDLTSERVLRVCTWIVFGGIGHRTQPFRSAVRSTRLPTAPYSELTVKSGV
ncbi:hypothetical protein TNCV_1898521 [Trichonephila clavipes]|uniref:Uncharacterized protein n=1 Tax=Trichonephila clavipes TaxID=2585209 RepID=A0A8X6WEM7_TRICX|nr:hypothetical protein TNCV_1898521 [Trichonephila clavipes]